MSGAGAVRLHAAGARRAGVQARRRDHGDGPHGSALVARRDRQQARAVSLDLRHSLSLLGERGKSRRFDEMCTKVFLL